MARPHRRWLRGVITIGMLGLAGTGMVLSNVAAVPEGQEATKKFVKKRITKVRNQLEEEIAAQVSETELIRYSERMNVGVPDRPIATIGPFTWSAHCADDGGSVLAQVLLTTSVDGASFDSLDDQEASFSTADPPQIWLGGNLGNAPGTTPTYWNYDAGGSVAGPDGTTVQGDGNAFANMGGFDCLLEGFLLRTSG
ncbi:MAG: hypothetical protein M3135_01125 [Actinomycetota bacterium]|nr:hypothetical protein [Actinomycetota bacterium]